MSKKVLVFFLLISFIFLNLQSTYAISTSCQSILLVDLNSNTVMYEKNANQKLYPASTTKIMTAILALELGNLDDKITVDEKTPYEIYGSSIALEEGEILTLKDLLYGLMLPSANDAASVIAKHYGGSLEGFVKLMNEKAKEIGATSTNFVNPHGLHDDNHYTTATDLSKIAKYAMQNETFREIVKTPRYEIPATNKKEQRAIITTNNLLLNTSSSYIVVNNQYITREYENAAGIKNGYTPEAGYCLVSYAQKNGIELVAVVLNGSANDVYTDTHNLLNYGFDNFQSKVVINANEFVQDLVLEDTKEAIPLVTEKSVSIAVKKDMVENLQKKVEIYDVSLPIKKGDVVGRVEFIQNGKLAGATNLVSTMSVEVELAFKDNNAKAAFKLPAWIKVIIAIFIGIIILRIYNKIRIRILKIKRKKRRQQLRKQYLEQQKNQQ